MCPFGYYRLAPGVVLAAIALLLANTTLAEMTVVRDASGRSIAVSDPTRIVSVGGSVTETLYALGLESHIVAVDSTSHYPERALIEKPSVGYMRQLSPEGVLGLAPTLILAAEGSGPKETVSVLKAASIPLVLVPDRFTGEGILEKIRVIAAATGAVKNGECLERILRNDLDALTQLRRHIDKPIRVLFVLSFMNDRPMVAGRETAAEGIIKLAGAVNAITDYEGYKLINEEAIIAARPDAVLVMQRSGQNLTAEAVFTRPAFTMTPAAARKAFISMEGLYLLGFGPRTALAGRDLIAALYPRLEADKFPSERAAPLAEVCRR